MSLDGSQCWPRGGTALLLAAALHADPARARAAWAEWEASGALEGADWATLRILPAVARRLPALGVASAALPRLAGVRRFLWTKLQNRIRLTRPHLAALAEAGILPVLTKGAARIALDPSLVAERYGHDIDLLIAPADWARAVDLLLARGLAPQPGWTRERLVHRLRIARHAESLRDGEVDLDLHQSALLLNRCLGDDDALRARALPGSLGGVRVLAPAAADRLTMAFGHGLLYDPARPGDWVLDAAAALADPALDWAVFEAEVMARGLSAFAEAGLGYLAEALGLPVPAAPRRRLAADATPPFREELASHFRSYDPATPREAAARCYAEAERARRAAARLPEGPPARGLLGTWQEAQSAAPLHIPLPEGADPRLDLRLELRFAALPPEGIACRLEAFETFVTELTAWHQREPTASLRLPGPLLRLRDAEAVRLHAPGAVPPVAFRWSSLPCELALAALPAARGAGDEVAAAVLELAARQARFDDATAAALAALRARLDAAEERAAEAERAAMRRLDALGGTLEALGATLGAVHRGIAASSIRARLRRLLGR